MKPSSLEAYRLLHDGTLALSRVEQAGMRIDVDRLYKTIDEIKINIRDLELQLKQDNIYTTWRKHFGAKTNLDSRLQLGVILFKVMGLDSVSKTATGRPTADEIALQALDLPFATDYLRLMRMKKLLSTYLKGVLREVVDGFLHPSFNLHLVRTFRSSGSDPNFQNIPIRDPEMGKLIRSCFIPRKDHVLVEIDYGQLEVRIAACYHKDPTMLQYILDGYDFHSELAKQCFILDESQVTKKSRFVAKNSFVFAQFYGSTYIDVAPNMWNAIITEKLDTSEGIGMYEHLKYHGITNRGTCVYKQSPISGSFEGHIKAIEDDFWGNRFPKYARWKDFWYNKYLQRGAFKMLTGFICQGVYKRNETINYPVQGAAFHCLLWSLIRMVRWLGKHKMRSIVIGQIHDSLILDCHKNELDDVLAMANQIMTIDLRKAWDWIILPLVIEAEVGENWFEKKEVKI